MEISQELLNQNKLKIDNLLAKMHNKNITDLEYQRLQYLLITQNILEYRSSLTTKPFIKDEYFDNYPTCEYNLADDKLIFVSDTHFGSKDENIKYLDLMTNYALKNGINNVIHTGDFVEGNCRKPYYNHKKEELEAELIRAINLWPSELRTKLLLGNHDFSSLKHVELINILFNNSPFQILGMGKALINWQDNPILIEHPISSIKFSQDNLDCLIKLRGHSHNYYADSDNKRIFIPALCNDRKDGSYELKRDYGLTFVPFNYELFIVAERIDIDKLLFKCIGFTRDDNNLKVLGSSEINTRTREMKKYGR